jgi:soluble lytic murein transglycosylase-like protein
MPPSHHQFDEATYPEAAAAPGCCSAYAFAPIAVLTIAVAAVAFAFRLPASAALASAAPASPASAGGVSAVFTPEVQHWAAAIIGWSSAAAMDPNLVATVMQIESCGNPWAVSRAGAMGLFQVMPYHFDSMDEPFVPDTNAKRGLAYLARSLAAAGGDARLALAGYNGGIGVIDLPEWAWPDETGRYAYWGSGIFNEASTGLETSPRLQEWLAAGGASLCRSANKQLGLVQN